MAFRELTVSERVQFFAVNPDLLLYTNIPAYGLCVGFGSYSVLVFKMQDGSVRLVDVGANCLAQFSQRFPPPEGLLEAALRLGEDFGRWIKVLVIVGIVAAVLWGLGQVRGL